MRTSRTSAVRDMSRDAHRRSTARRGADHRHLGLGQVGGAARPGRRRLFCVDNLPPELLRDFIRWSTSRFTRRVAVAVDVRNAGSLPHLLPLIDAAAREGVHDALRCSSTPAPTRWCGASPRRAPAPPVHQRGRRRRHALIDAIELERDAAGRPARVSTVHRPPASCARPARAGCADLVGAGPADAGVRVLRLQARRAAGCRLRVRRARAAQPHYLRELRPADRAATRRWSSLSGGAARGARDAAADRDFLRRWLPRSRTTSAATSRWPSAAPAASTARCTWSELAALPPPAPRWCAPRAGRPRTPPICPETRMTAPAPRR